MTQDKPKEVDLSKITLDDVLTVFPKDRLEEHHYTESQPIVCKWCDSMDIMKYGTRKDVQEYICKKCGRKFIAKTVIPNAYPASLSDPIIALPPVKYLVHYNNGDTPRCMRTISRIARSNGTK